MLGKVSSAKFRLFMGGLGGASAGQKTPPRHGVKCRVLAIGCAKFEAASGTSRAVPSGGPPF